MTSLAAASEALIPLLGAFLLTFCRIGAAFMTFPAFTDHIPQKSRLVAALAVSMPLSLIAGPTAPNPEDFEGILKAIMSNTLLGLYFGLSARLMLAAMQMAGQMFGQISGLYNPFNTTGLAFEGSTIIASMMTLAGTALIFAADLHIEFLKALGASFQTVGLNGTIDPTILNEGIVTVIAKSFQMAVQFAAPFIVLGLVFNLALGICNRMMPVLPVFFVFSPVLIIIGILLIVLIFGAVASHFVEELSFLITGL